MTTEELGGLRAEVYELRGEVRGTLEGVERALDGTTDALGEMARVVSQIGQTCAARGVVHAQIAERFERHSDTMRLLKDSQGAIVAIESTVARHDQRIETIEEAQRRLGIRADVADGKRTAITAWAREVGLLLLKASIGGAAVVGAVRGTIAVLRWLGG